MRNRLPLRATAKTSAIAALAGIAAAVTASTGIATGPATPANVTLAAAGTQTSASGVVNDGRTVRYAGLAIEIPAAGAGVSAAAQSTSGDLTLTVSRNTDGTIVVTTDKHEHGTAEAQTGERGTAQAAAASSTRAAAAKTCTDSAYLLSGWKMPGFAWYYNPAGAPAAIAGSAGSAITNATVALSRTCGQRAIGLTPAFAGQTRATVQVGAAGNCTGNDGKNVIGWRAGSGRWLGMTCTYFRTANGRKTVTGTDTALNTRYRFFTSTANCSNAYDLTSVVLHERGHSLGLNHVDQNTHASAVMTPALSACSIGKRTLGLGDYRGLAALYGTR